MRIPQGVSGLGLANFAPTQAAGKVTPDQVMSALRSGDPGKLQALKDQISQMDPKDQKALYDQLQQAAKQLNDPRLDDFLKYLEEMLGIKQPSGGGGGGGGGGAGKAGGGGGGGGAQGAGGAEGGGGAGGAEGGGGAGGAQGAGGAGGGTAAQGAPHAANLPNSFQVSNPKIQQALAGISKDPEGGRLLNAALQKGLVKVVENKNLPPGVEGRYTNNGAGKGIIEVRDANSPDLVATVAHELGHAATPENNTSQLEERAVDAIGARIQARVTGHGKDWQLNTDAYSDLPWDNNIKQALKLIGVDM